MAGAAGADPGRREFSDMLMNAHIASHMFGACTRGDLGVVFHFLLYQPCFFIPRRRKVQPSLSSWFAHIR